MSFQKSSSQLVANKWHPQPTTGCSKYPSPQGVLRASLGEENYKFVSETVTSDHIRCAAVLPLGVPFSHLLDVPWGMNYRTPDWRMIIVSTLDTNKWLDLCRASGAIGWLKASNMTITYQWEKPPLDPHNCKIRPPNALGITARPAEDRRSDVGVQRKNYDKVSLVDDLRGGQLTHQQIADKYELSRNRIHSIAKEYGIVSTNARKVIGA
jgi:hypothetical protein